MIIVLATVESTAEDISTLRDAIVAMEKATATEAGSISYTFTTEIGNPDTIRVIEQWESMDALAAHFGTPHMATFNETMASYPPKSISAKVYEVAQELELPI